MKMHGETVKFVNAQQARPYKKFRWLPDDDQLWSKHVGVFRCFKCFNNWHWNSVILRKMHLLEQIKIVNENAQGNSEIYFTSISKYGYWHNTEDPTWLGVLFVNFFVFPDLCGIKLVSISVITIYLFWKLQLLLESSYAPKVD
jgi:hypothetical protein